MGSFPAVDQCWTWNWNSVDCPRRGGGCGNGVEVINDTDRIEWLEEYGDQIEPVTCEGFPAISLTYYVDGDVDEILRTVCMDSLRECIDVAMRDK